MSGSEALPALETTRFEGGAPGSSLHAMTEAVTALPTSNLWLVCPFHDRVPSKSEGEDRLRSVPKLCQSVGSANRGIDRGPRPHRSAKNSDESRKEPMGISSLPRLENGMANYGKTIYYLGFPCGKMEAESSTPLISAFLTIHGPLVDTRQS